jgi:hypothetical protein
MKKGFVLVTVLILIFAILFLGLAELTYSNVSAQRIEKYYQNIQQLYQQDSLRAAAAYQKRANAQP